MTIRDAITGRIVGDVGVYQWCEQTIYGGWWVNRDRFCRDATVGPKGRVFEREDDARHELMALDLERWEDQTAEVNE